MDAGMNARFPGLTAAGQALLDRLREHPHAPRYTAVCGHRLTPEYLGQVRAFDRELQTTPAGWPAGSRPDWLDGFVDHCFDQVPVYRRCGARPARFEDVPPCDRSDLSREPWSFVPDSQPLDDLIWYGTSGTTGHPLTVISHPVVGGCYTPLVRAALALAGVRLESGPGQVACALVGLQRRAYTYPSLSPQQGGAGHVKLNLHPDDWARPEDRALFLDDLNPEIYTGDPLAFAELMRLPLTTRPRALVSTAMTLLPGMRQALEGRFHCPVVDLYAMNESGPIAARIDSGSFHLLHHRLYVEILDPSGAVCGPGVRGEVTLTGGFNPFLPLLRYRTNDYAALIFSGGRPVLVDLEGRPPVVYRARDGRAVSTLDVTAALKPLALEQFALHQEGGGGLILRARGGAAALEAGRAAVQGLFGPDQPITVSPMPAAPERGAKVVQYTSDLG